MNTDTVKLKRVLTPSQPENNLASPPPKKQKESSGTPPVASASTPASVAPTIKTKKVFDEKGNPKALVQSGPSSSELLAEREAAYIKARDYLKKASPLPLKIGDVTIECLGSIMVEKNDEPVFHSNLRLWPIGFRATYQDPATSIRYICEVLDGMDTKLRKNAPAFSVRIMAHREHHIIENSIYAAWKAVTAWQVGFGTAEEQEAAKLWDPRTLVDRFGLSLKEVRRRVEGLPGARECMRYQFLGTKAVPTNRTAGAGAGTGAGAGVGSKSKSPEPRKKKQKTAHAAGEEEGGKPVKNIGPRGFFVFHAEIKDQVKAELRATSGDKDLQALAKKAISSRWAALTDEAKQVYHARAEAKRQGEPAAVIEVDAAEPEPEPEPESTDNALYRNEGPYVGERARRFIFNDKEQPIDVADGVIFGYLSVEDQGDDVYLSEETNTPAALWRMQFDDTAFGTEDLEEHEVREAIALLKEPLSEKLQQKHEKRLEKLAQKKAKMAEKQAERERLRQEKESERERQRLEKEMLRMEKDKGAKAGDTAAGVLAWGSGAQSQVQTAARVMDEALRVIQSGPHRGKKACAVPIPSGSLNSFPPAEHAANFLAMYAFLRDLSGPLGAVRMSFEELCHCFNDEAAKALPDKRGEDAEMPDADESKKEDGEATQESDGKSSSGEEASGLESFCELAVWLTKLAVRSKHIREVDESPEYEMGLVQLRDPVEDIKLSPGPLLSPAMKDSETITYSCWHLVNEASWPEMTKLLIKTSPLSEEYTDLLAALDLMDPKDFPQKVKFEVLDFLRDEVCACDKVRKIINNKLREADRIQDKKRVEDAALRKSKDYKIKPKAAADADAGGAEAGGNKPKPLGSLDIMKLLHEQDPQPFEFKHQGKVFKATLDTSGVLPKLRGEGQIFDTPMQWLMHVRQKDKLPGMATKAVIFYKGKSLRDCEASVSSPAPARSVSEPAEAAPAEDEASIGVDAERRKREFEAAMLRAEKGLRLEAVGQDRHLRRYWCFDGVTDRVWVSPDSAMDTSDGSGNGAVDWGFDGLRTQSYASLRRATEEAWPCYSVADGTLAALYGYLANGPMGPRESMLLERLRDLKIRGGFSGAEGGGGQADGAAAEPQGAAEADDGYEWKQLPHIGDVVWARKGADPKTALWYPVLVVDPEGGDEPAPADDDGDVSEDDEWQRSGSEYLGKRVLLTIFDNRRSKSVSEKGRIVGWLPAEIADFKSEATGENAALWRVRLDDKAFSSQDLEEYEVKEAMKNHAKAEAQKRNKDSEYLSSKSMFGQAVKWLYGQYFDDRQETECFPLKDVLPFVEFREERIQEMRRANKARVLVQVERANQYLEEHSTSQDREEDLREIWRELGLSIRAEQVSPEFQASCRNCMRHPRVMTVVQRNRDYNPMVASVQELREQLLALYGKLEAQIAFVEEEAVVKRFDKWAETAQAAQSLGDVMTAVTALEALLSDLANGETEEVSFVADEEDKWRTEGNEWIGKRIRRPVKSRFGQTIDHVKAKVVGWLPKEESDFFDEAKQPAPLWHVLWEDGDEEDLEEFEVREGMRSLVESGDSPDLSGNHGIWDCPRDRDSWARLAAASSTMAAAALALYLVGDRALHFVAVYTKEVRFAQEEWDDHCYISGEGGGLMCCESCPRTALPASLGLARAPKGDYFCAYCVREQNRRERRGGPAAAAPNPPAERPAQRGGGGAAASKAKKASGKGGGRGGDLVERLRKSIVRHGVHDGSICEVAAAKRDERCFVKVLDGNVDKAAEDPAIRSCQYFTEWRGGKEPKRMQLSRKKGPVPVRLVLQVGSTTDLLEGDHRQGFAPFDAR